MSDSGKLSLQCGTKDYLPETRNNSLVSLLMRTIWAVEEEEGPKLSTRFHFMINPVYDKRENTPFPIWYQRAVSQIFQTPVYRVSSQ